MTWLLSDHASYIKFFILVSYPYGMNLDRIGGWVIVSDRNQTWTALGKERLFKKKSISQDHHVAEPLGRGGAQELQKQGAISNRIPSCQLCFVRAYMDEDSLLFYVLNFIS